MAPSTTIPTDPNDFGLPYQLDSFICSNKLASERHSRRRQRTTRMSTVPHGEPGATPPPFRIAPQLHQILYKRPGRDKLEPTEDVLPEPPYPQRPDAREMTHKEYLKLNGVRMWKTWGAPYFRSRSLKNRHSLRPIIPYLFTDWKCNLDCHYCWSYDKQ